ncbi:MAG: hypothetical protein ACYCUF_09115, partial [Acidimicrobiales bacterium]
GRVAEKYGGVERVRKRVREIKSGREQLARRPFGGASAGGKRRKKVGVTEGERERGRERW